LCFLCKINIFRKKPCKNVVKLIIYRKNCLYPIWQNLPKKVKVVRGEKIAVTSDYNLTSIVLQLPWKRLEIETVMSISEISTSKYATYEKVAIIQLETKNLKLDQWIHKYHFPNNLNIHSE